MLLAEIMNREARLAYLGEVVRLPDPPKRQNYPASLVEVTNELVSTLDLRRHALAAYATAMAYYGEEAAFDAAVAETLRRRPNWDRTVAIRHTRRFIVSAYHRAFPTTAKPGDR